MPKLQALVFAVVMLTAQAFGEDTPSFEVASIKPSDPASYISVHRSGNRLFTTNTSLQFLITWAYDIRNDRLSGKPAWLDSVRYDVAAVAPRENPGPGQLRRMMQSLLQTRFNLAIHRETRELPMYVMVVDKNGAKVQLTDPEGGIGQNPFNMPGRGRLTGTQVSAEMLANVLSVQLGRTVQDETGLKGVFDFKLEWEPDTNPQSASADGADVRTGPSIFTALPEQLGLKLESRKGPVEVIVIDHVESIPTEN